MFNKKNHMESLSNVEIKARKMKKLLSIGLPIVIILVIILLISIGNLGSLMGNSTFTYYCENSEYKLVGDKCEKVVETNFFLLGDINGDFLIDNEDLELLRDYLDKEDTDDEFVLSDSQILSADLNDDMEVSESDYSVFSDYFTKAVSTYSKYYEKIGVEKKCPYNYQLNGNKCIYKETIDANKKESNNDIKYTITFDANGGIGNMPSLSMTNNETIKLPKNEFTNGVKKFAGWTVYSKTKNKWLCYLKNTDKNNVSNRDYKNEVECNYGKTIISDSANVSGLANINRDSLVFYAIWIDDNNSSVDVSLKSNTDNKYINKNEKVLITVDIKVTGSTQYYYKWNTYSYDKLHYESNCQKVVNGSTALKSLTMFSDRQGGIQLYTDDKCNIKYNDEYKTAKYECNGCNKVSAVFDDIKTTSYKKGTVVNNYVHFDINDTSKKYYYIWRTYQNSNLVYTSNCQSVEADKKFTKGLTINGARKGTITVYSDSSCKNIVTTTNTKRFTCSDYPPLKISISKNVATNQTKNTVVHDNINIDVYDKEDQKYYYVWKTYKYGSEVYINQIVN